MEIQFYPLDFDSKTIDGKNYVRIFGRTVDDKRICVYEEFDQYFWILTEHKKDVKQLLHRVENAKIMTTRTIYVKRAEIREKKLLGKPVTAIKVVLNSPADLKDVLDEVGHYKGSRKKLETDISVVKKYIRDKKISPLTLYKVEGSEFSGDLRVDHCIKGKITPESSDVLKPRKLAFDIECYNKTIGDPENPIVMLAFYGDGFKKVISWKKFDYENLEVVEDEKELLMKFKEILRSYKPDYLIGYFSDGFDFPYLKARADKYHIKLDVNLDRSSIRMSQRIEKSVRVKGFVHLDIFKFIKHVMSGDVAAGALELESLSLDNVSNVILGERKEVVDLDELWKAWDENKDLDKYASYNLKDAELTFRICEKILPNLHELVKLVGQPLHDVSRMTFGQLIESYLIKNSVNFNEICLNRPSLRRVMERRQATYVGGFVFEPKPGVYENLAVFDFRGLHPSIISAHNICLSSLTENKEHAKETPEIEGRKYYFDYKEEGFIPKLIRELVERRIRIKQIIKDAKEKDPVLNARSYALKIIAAGFHGYMGYAGARWYSVECAEGILAYVRYYMQNLIKKANEFGFNVIYGDSVDGKTKVFVRENGKIYEEEIESLFKKVDKKSVLEKEYNFKDNLEILTLDKKGHSVFKPLIYVMRHKCNKKMYRINFTNRWHIDVTEDHSLMGYQNLAKANKARQMNALSRIIEVKPSEIKKKLKSIVSLKHIPYDKIKSKSYPKEIYEFMGYFIGDGSFTRNKSHQKYDKDYYLGLSLGLDYKEIVEKLINPLIEQGHIKNYWLSKTRKGDIKLNGLKLIRLISPDFRNKKGKKSIPKWIFEENGENIGYFLRGLFSADGSVMLRHGAPIIRYTSINEEYIEEVRRLLYRVGVAHSVFKENNPNFYRTEKKTYSNKSYSKHIIIKDRKAFLENIGFLLERKNKRAYIKTCSLNRKFIDKTGFDIQGVKEIKEIEKPRYVYDLEVEDTHTFFGNYVLAHNTDSVFVELKDKTQGDAQKFLRSFNKDLPSLMELELEDYYPRGVFVMKKGEKAGAKKKYALIDENGKIKIRGFETVRRDWSHLAREVQSKVLELILRENDVEGAVEYVRKTIDDIRERRIPIEKMVIRTQLKKELDEYESIGPHVAVARKIGAKAGSVIKYVVCEGVGLIRDRAKSFDEAEIYDAEYYINNQVLPAISRVFEAIGFGREGLISKFEQKKLGEF